MEPRSLGPYRILKRLGSGGMGIVYLAEDSRLGRRVAVKVLPSSANPEALRRFVREARTAAALQHPHIAVLYDVGKDAGVSYLVMERVEGESLRAAIGKGALPLNRVLEIGEQLASALGQAHSLGVLHGDIKPGNIMISPGRGAVLMDFGLAQWLDVLPPNSDVSETPTQTVAKPTREIAGTATYMSPEQLRGESLDWRSDLFQLGMTLYEATAGHSPFQGPTIVDKQHAILHAEPQPLHEIAETPVEFSRIVGKLLEKERQDRYPDARALEVDLRALQRDSSSDAAHISGLHFRARRRAGPLRAGVLAAIGLIAIGLPLVLWWSMRPPTASPIPSKLLPFTYGESNDTYPSFSPDGKSIVFASDRGGNWDLWVALISGGTPVQITRTPEVETDSTWSPEGTQIAFVRGRMSKPGSDLFVMPSLGGDARKLVSDAMDPAWSPNGHWIAFSDLSEGWTRIAKRSADFHGDTIPMTDLEEGFFHRRPAWSPDSKTIVFNRSPGGWVGRLMRVSSDGGSPREITDDPEGTENLASTVTPDGRYVVHASDRGGSLNLWRIPIRGGLPERITSGAGRDIHPHVSPDGRRIVFVNDPVVGSVIVVSLEDGTERAIARLGGNLAWSPVLSPDGSTIAFSRKVPGSRWEMVLMDHEGGHVRTILDGLPDVLWTRIHPDGRSLVFHAGDPGGGRIGRVGLDGTGLSWLTDEEDGDAGYPDVSPDGAYLAFTRGRPEGVEVVVRTLLGDEEVLVLENATLPSFSPDGKLLAVARTRSYAGGVGVVELDGGETRWLTDSGTWPTWMPDGRSLAFADAASDHRQRAWIVPLDGGHRRLLGPFRWDGAHYPFVIDPASGHLITTDTGTDGGRSTIWIAEY